MENISAPVAFPIAITGGEKLIEVIGPPLNHNLNIYSLAISLGLWITGYHKYHSSRAVEDLRQRELLMSTTNVGRERNHKFYEECGD